MRSFPRITMCMPERSKSHDTAHVVSALGQVPVGVLAGWAARCTTERSRRSAEAPAR